MKAFIVLTAVLGSFLLSTDGLCVHKDISVERRWHDFKIDFNKTYRTYEEEVKRAKIFRQNSAKFAKHNELYAAGSVSFKIGVNQHADKIFSELFKSFYEMQKRHEKRLRNKTKITEFPKKFEIDASFVVPDELDWREKGAVTAVRDQKECGSCWGQGVVASIEAQHFLQTGNLTQFSVQQLVDCSTENLACDGGSPQGAFSYLIKHHITTESSYPYKAVSGSCAATSDDGDSVNVETYVEMHSGDEELLKRAIAQAGPVVVGINFLIESFWLYSEGIYFDLNCKNDLLNHIMLAVGYGTDEVTGYDYWIVKNSFGAQWGENGYIRIRRNAGNHCGIATMFSYPILKNATESDNESE